MSNELQSRILRCLSTAGALLEGREGMEESENQRHILPERRQNQQAGMRKLRMKGRFFNHSILNVHCPHEERPDDEKEGFYAKLEQVYDGCSRRDVKIVIGHLNAQVGREEMFRPVIGPDSLHTISNDNCQRCINFAATHGMVVRSSFFPRKDIHKAT